MISIKDLREIYDYNYWARDRQLKACTALSGEQLLRPMGSSFASVRDTLAHMMGTEWIWLERWRGRSPRTMPGVPEGLPFAETLRRWHEQFETVEAIRERWQGIEADLKEYLSALQEEHLAKELVYTNLKRQTWKYPLWRTLLHVANHGTYHRGQISTLLHQMGASVKETDYLVMQDEGLLH